MAYHKPSIHTCCVILTAELVDVRIQAVLRPLPSANCVYIYRFCQLFLQYVAAPDCAYSVRLLAIMLLVYGFCRLCLQFLASADFACLQGVGASD
jgi:hypothetical protein